MKDRLIDLLHDSDLSLDSVRLADHLLANGVIVLPCKMGSKVYDISEFVDKHPYPEMFEFSTDEIILSRCRKTKELIFGIDGINYTFDEFGTRVFASEKEAEKEAEKALAERSENEKGRK